MYAYLVVFLLQRRRGRRCLLSSRAVQVRQPTSRVFFCGCLYAQGGGTQRAVGRTPPLFVSSGHGSGTGLGTDRVGTVCDDMVPVLRRDRVPDQRTLVLRRDRVPDRRTLVLRRDRVPDQRTLVLRRDRVPDQRTLVPRRDIVPDQRTLVLRRDRVPDQRTLVYRLDGGRSMAECIVVGWHSQLLQLTV